MLQCVQRTLTMPMINHCMVLILSFGCNESYFAKFGLGSKTGIDMPYEEPGYIGKRFVSGLLLDYSIGQFDSILQCN